MTATGLTLESPKIGQTITFRQTAQDMVGEQLVIEARMRGEELFEELFKLGAGGKGSGRSYGRRR